MAALSDNATSVPRHVAGTPHLELIYPCSVADEFYIGSICCIDTATGLVVIDNADADESLGICMDRLTTTAASDPVRVHVKGVWWIACANFETANLFDLMAPAAGSDNPADIDDQGVATPSALGRLIHVGTTAVDGYLDLDDKSAVANA